MLASVCSGILWLAQLNPESLHGEPLIQPEGQVPVYVAVAVFVVGIVLISVRSSKRDRVEK